MRAETDLPEVLFITSYPPRECGIATYSQDLIGAMNILFGKSFSIKVCALISGKSEMTYPEEVINTLNTSLYADYLKLARFINQNKNIETVLIQHEFGFFSEQPEAFLRFLYELIKPVVLVFHTVLPQPSHVLLSEVKSMVSMVESVIVMTKNAAGLLIRDYGIPSEKINIIAHGTHLVRHTDATSLKEKYGLSGRKVLTTFGLLSSGKDIETTLDALPAIVRSNPEVMFLIIGKTHPEVFRREGEKYRESLENKVKESGLMENVRFINKYLALPDLLEYLQLTDIYLFTTSDPNQAVSGTFAYAMSCACPIISTPIPHAREMISEDTGIIIDFRNSRQVETSVIHLLNDDSLRTKISINTLQKIISTSWQNSAVAHTLVLEKIASAKILPQYNLPVINLDHIRQLTTKTGMIQFSKINQPDIESGYTLDDNARALIAIIMHYEQTGDNDDLTLIGKYLGFIKYCQQPDGNFLNYVDKNRYFTEQNRTNLDDANGRAIWALGYTISKKSILPVKSITLARRLFNRAIHSIVKMQSPRGIAFAMKGLFYYHSKIRQVANILRMESFANKLVRLFKHEASENWNWFESYLTYANSIMPEAMLYAWLMTGKSLYKFIAIQSMNFLMTSTFSEKRMEVIPNKGWRRRGDKPDQTGNHQFGEQPIDVAYTVMTLDKFYTALRDKTYLRKLVIAFNWFLGNNRLHQIVYNPCTGGCFDGLEDTHVNLNQGAESTVSYHLARFTVEKYKNEAL